MTPALLLGLLLSVSTPERLALIRVDPGGSVKKPLDLEIRPVTGQAADCVDGIVAGDRSFLKAAGGKPLRFAFALDLDGDGTDEIGAVREHRHRPDRRMELRVYRPPSRANGSTGAPLARSRRDSLGRGKGNGRLAGIGSIDRDGDGRDDLLTVRQWSGGRQSLEIRTPPRSGKKAVGPVLASITSFGTPSGDSVVGLFGSDVDGDGADDVVSVRRDVFGLHQVLVHRQPSGPDEPAGTLVASAPDLLPYVSFQGTAVLGAQRADLEGDGQDELLLLLEHPYAPHSRWLALFRLPTFVGEDLGMPILVDWTVTGSLTDRSTLFVSSLRAPQELPDLTGSFDLFVEAYSPGAAERRRTASGSARSRGWRRAGAAAS